MATVLAPLAALLDDEGPEPSSLFVYAQQLQRCLDWDPLSGTEGREKQVFVEALTEIAALPLDSSSMEIRRLLVVSRPEDAAQQQQHSRESQSSGDAELAAARSPLEQQHLLNLIAALSTRDVLLKCKAANAVGSLCISRVAGQQLLDLHGAQILMSVAKMATCKNQWAQGDAFFVLGWMVVIADEEMLASIAQLLPSIVKCLHHNLNLPVNQKSDARNDEETGDSSASRSQAALASSEQASNFRVYALVLLLNFCQRDVSVFMDRLESVLSMLRDLVVKLLAAPPSFDCEDMSTTSFFESSEYAEVLRLAITLLGVLVDELESATSLLLELKMVPPLLKLKRVLDSDQISDLVGEAGTQDLTERLEALIETLLLCR
ncbi:hypothetical protein BBJ28_00000594 [Nothophytophthora sp. Chile5]|nr:hypothetical protein BBJ28_00000594 [Nothophytophthora sp. Chile5]